MKVNWLMHRSPDELRFTQRYVRLSNRIAQPDENLFADLPRAASLTPLTEIARAKEILGLFAVTFVDYSRSEK
jgi:hypothetical protein